MRLVYLALSGIPDGCILFYGISLLSAEKSTSKELYLVFELASEGSIWKYIVNKGSNFEWQNLIDIFSNLAWGLWDGLHSKNIAHGYLDRFAIYIDENISDLHENNVLVTNRFYPSDPHTPEAKRPVLIDFGRGSVSSIFPTQDNGRLSDSQHGISHFGLLLRTIPEDIQAYGGLIWELTSRWMQMTSRRTLPCALVELIRDCLSLNLERLKSMEGVVRAFEALERQLQRESHQGKGTILDVSLKEAKVSINLELARASDRPKPATTSSRQTDLFSFPTIGWTYDSDEEDL